MFNMITVIIAVALVTVITLTGFFYGGGAFSDNTIAAEAARYRNEAAQIAAAVTLFRAQGNEITSEFSLQTLVDGGYLATLPLEWEPGSDIIMKALETTDPASEEICFTANKQASFKFAATEPDVQVYSLDTNFGIPHCDKSELDANVPCCVNN